MSETCINCQSLRLVSVSGKSADLNTFVLVNGDHEVDGDVPCDIGIGCGDYLEFTYCLDCGQIQGDFPLAKTEMESDSVGHVELDEDGYE